MVDKLDFTLDSVSAYTTYGFELQGIPKNLMPEQDEATVDIFGKPGITQLYKKFSKLMIPVYGNITGTSYSNLLSRIDAFSGWLYGDTDKELIFSNRSTKYYNAQILGKIRDTRLNAVKSRIDFNFTCNNPFAYDTTETSDDQTITVNDDTYILANGGHYYAWPVITITFNQAQTHIYLQNNTIPGNRMDIAKAFNLGDEIEIDCWNGTIRLNGSLSPIGLGDGGQGLAEWPLLAVGNNEFQAGSDDESIDIDIETIFRKTYLS